MLTLHNQTVYVNGAASWTQSRVTYDPQAQTLSVAALNPGSQTFDEVASYTSATLEVRDTRGNAQFTVRDGANNELSVSVKQPDCGCGGR